MAAERIASVNFSSMERITASEVSVNVASTGGKDDSGVVVIFSSLSGSRKLCFRNERRWEPIGNRKQWTLTFLPPLWMRRRSVQ